MENLPEIQLNEPIQDSNSSSFSSSKVDKLAEALAKASLKFDAITKSTANTFYKSKYADLEAVIKAVRNPLAENGLVVIQAPSTVGKDVILTTVLLHTTGQWIKSSCTCPCEKFDAQGIGKAISYLRRYSLQALLNLAAEDDDGNEASGKDVTKSNKPAFVTGMTVRKTEKSPVLAAPYGSENEQPKTSSVPRTAQGVVNVHGLEITDDDLPDFDSPAVDPTPTPSQSKVIAERLRALKQDSRTLKSWVEKQAGSEWSKISFKKFQDILTELETSPNVTQLIGA